MIAGRETKWLGGIVVLIAASTLAIATSGGCSGRPSVDIDGSSTVKPITAYAAEIYEKGGGNAKVTVGVAGTGGGFKKFVLKEIDICNASRPISEEEKKKCADASIEYLEFQVAIDGLAVIVHPQNDFVTCLTFGQLKKIWDQGTTVKTWKDVDPAWPNEKIQLYGPGDDSGTFDYFTEVVNGKTKRSRSDFTPSEDDNQLVVGVQGNKYALAYFGYAYYYGNKDKIKLLEVDKGEGCILPTDETVLSGKYPLSRPLFIYVNQASLRKPAVAEFVKFYLEQAHVAAAKVRYVPAPDTVAKANLARLADAMAKLAPGK